MELSLSFRRVGSSKIFHVDGLTVVTLNREALAVVVVVVVMKILGEGTLLNTVSIWAA